MPLLLRHPLAASLVAAAAVVVLAATLVLPRLDGLEIAAATALVAPAPGPATGVARMTIEVDVHYRLASAPAGILVVRSPAPEGGRDDDRHRREITAGTGLVRVVLTVPRREAAPVVATIEPGGAGGWLDSLQTGRRRDFRVVVVP